MKIKPALRAKKSRKLQTLIEEKKKKSTAATAQTPRKKRTRRFKRQTESRPLCTKKTLVLNLSGIPITETQEEVLGLGPDFCPRPSTINRKQFVDDVSETCRKVRLRELHHKKEEEDSDGEERLPFDPRFYKPTGYLQYLIVEETQM